MRVSTCDLSDARRCPVSRAARELYTAHFWRDSFTLDSRSLQLFCLLGLWNDRRAMGGSRAPSVGHAGRWFRQSRL